MKVINDQRTNEAALSEYFAEKAVKALIEEAELTPKPGLVDQNNSGSHHDLNIDLMIRSAKSLHDTFAEIGRISFKRVPDQSLREDIAAIGRHGENVMFQATGGTNTHKGAIWAMGLLTSSAAIHPLGTTPERIAVTAGKIARFADRFAPKKATHGTVIQQRFGAPGARGEAELGFPHVVGAALPALYDARNKGIPEPLARIDTLITIISRLDDTCLLHRGGMDALKAAKEGAKTILDKGGSSTQAGWRSLQQLDAVLIEHNASPGGSADLLAAALFLDSLP
ncbi:triphosphoribosyl-dephospho-CoA synthase [Scopulibacillus darangshiensis]|uniref:triphosphoribosyl-dephospho-CoA synthase n=1 Tax=Scopulibacillus darangshiensis TaxID=442528 RepID=A0A4R2P9W1_9BACL|nr:triphosphoribosyl-dephospho-CoA synthase [Scopulibacillus darangshiensis]TCP30871.1 triphosphoribosyl-dephospho-CoA synthase [Scopulibacillus darangshiensis]